MDEQTERLKNMLLELNQVMILLEAAFYGSLGKMTVICYMFLQQHML